ncbi:MAG TPA: hypothetical protein ACHBX0_02645 [Arsenophonus sp.]
MSENNYLWLLLDDNLAYFFVLLIIFSAPPTNTITNQSFQVAATIANGCVISGGTLFGIIPILVLT